MPCVVQQRQHGPYRRIEPRDDTYEPGRQLPRWKPSNAGITNETYIGAERREPGAVTLKGDWHTDRQYVELKKGSGDIVVPFVAGEVNLVMQPGPSGRAAVTVLLDGKPVGDARGMDVGTDGVARFDRSGMIRLVAGAPQRKHVLTLSSNDTGLRVCVHLRSLRNAPAPMSQALA